MNLYKEAPTWLYDLDGNSKLFQTQDEVDAAWGDGWFGPPYSVTPLISEVEWRTKADIADAVGEDPRYDGLVINSKKPKAEIMEKIKAFEEDFEITNVVVED